MRLGAGIGRGNLVAGCARLKAERHRGGSSLIWLARAQGCLASNSWACGSNCQGQRRGLSRICVAVGRAGKDKSCSIRKTGAPKPLLAAKANWLRRKLLVAQTFDRIKLGGAGRRDGAEDYSDHR